MKRAGVPGTCFGEASIFHVSFEGKPGLAGFDRPRRGDLYQLLRCALLNNGVDCASHHGWISAVHTDADIERTVRPTRRPSGTWRPTACSPPAHDKETTMIDLTLEIAEQAARAARAKAKELGTPMTVTVVDESGRVVYTGRGDGAGFFSVNTSRAKATAAANWRKPTKELGDLIAKGSPFWTTVASVVPGELLRDHRRRADHAGRPRRRRHRLRRRHGRAGPRVRRGRRQRRQGVARARARLLESVPRLAAHPGGGR